MFGERGRRAAAARGARLGQVDDQPHDPRGRGRGRDQDGARAAPPRAAADAGLRRARTRSSSSSRRRSTSTPRRVLGSTAAPEPRRAGVNAFGFGGINAHAVLEECNEDPAAADAPARLGQRGLFCSRPSPRPACVERGPRTDGGASSATASSRSRSCAFTRSSRELGRIGATRSGWRSSLTPRSRTSVRSCGRRSTSSPTRLQADQDRQRHLLRVRAARPRRQGRARLPGRGLAVPEHAGRPLPALSRGPRRVRPHRPPVRRPSARASCSAIGCSRGPRSPMPSAQSPNDG